VAVKVDAHSEFRLRHMILSDTTLHLYKTKEDVKVVNSVHLSDFKMRCVQDYKREGFILKLQKDKKVLEIAFRTIEEAREWINCLLESVPSISFMNTKEEAPQEKAEDTVDSSMTIDVMVKQLNVMLFNEIFEKTTLLNIQYLDVKYSQDKASKVKLSFDSVLLENFEKTYASRGLKTIVWIGSTQAPAHDDTKTILADVSQLGESVLNQPTFSNISQIHEPEEFETQSKRRKLTKEPSARTLKSPSKRMTLASPDKETPLNTTANPRHNLEKGMILFLAMDKTTTDIDLHIVNVMTYFDSDYINNLIKRLDQYKKKSLTPTATPAKVKPKKKPSVAVEKLLMKINMKIDRLTLVCRSKSLNLFDIVFMNMRMIYSSFNTRMLINLYAKKFALRDLTNYPFTKSPHELRDYKNQNKQIIASFDSSGSNAETLDNNCLIVLCEILQSDMVKADKIGTKAEIILNNGEINFFMQPIFRFLDFLFFPMMGLLVPDDTLTASLDVLRQRVTDPTKLSYNVFLKNTRINMLPNHLSDRMLKFEIPMIKIVNQINVDASRKKVANNELKLHSENISIEMEKPRIRGLKEGLDFLEAGQIVISFEKLGYAGYLNRLLGPDRGRLI
jgi:hypothetical protein